MFDSLVSKAYKLDFHIKHVTTYEYDRPVSLSHNLIKVYPIQDLHQTVQSHFISVSGNPLVKPGTDIFGNNFGIFSLPSAHSQLVIISEMEVTTERRNIAWDVLIKQPWDDLLVLSLDSSFRLFLNPKHFFVLPEIWSAVNLYNRRIMTPWEMVLAFNEYVYSNFTYNPSATVVDTPVEQVWLLKAGVCQDFSHVLIYMLRSVNIPARYVSGYICPNNDGMRGDGATHAWVEAYLPNFGWIGVDPTNNCLAKEKHVRVAVGRDYQDVAPVTGRYQGSARQTLKAVVTVSYKE